MINIAIARQLFPADYGLVAMVLIFVQFSDILVDGGLNRSLIRKPDLVPEDLTTIFLFNLGVACFLYLTFFFSAPYISQFFTLPKFTSIARILGIVIFLNSLSMVQNALLTRETKFKLLAKINITANITSGIAGLVAAYSELGVWSLVIQTITKSFLTTSYYWLSTSWVPKLRFSKDAFINNFRFGYNIVLGGLINSLFSNLYNLVIGKVHSAEKLGYYAQGKRLGELTSQTFYILFQRTSFPILSSIQNEEQRFKEVYLKLISFLAYISFPVACLMILIGKPMILILLTPKWSNAIPFFKILCFSGMFFPITGLSAYACLAKGRSDLYLKLEIVYKAMTVLLIGITYKLDILWMVSGQAFLMIVQFLVNFIITGKIIKLNTNTQLAAVFPSFILSIVAFFFGYCLSVLFSNPFLLIFMQILFYLFIFIAGSYLMKFKELITISEFVVSKLKVARR